MDLRSVILENDMTESGGDALRSFEPGISRDNSKWRDFFLDAPPLATNGKKTCDHEGNPTDGIHLHPGFLNSGQKFSGR